MPHSPNTAGAAGEDAIVRYVGSELPSRRGHLLWVAACVLYCLVGLPPASIADAPAVVLGTFEIPDGFDHPESIRATFEPLVVHGLEVAGYAVIPSRDAAPVWEARRRAYGPFFDPITGQEYAERTRAARQAALFDFAGHRAAVAWLRPALELRPAPFERGKASWDGASEGAKPIGAGQVTGISIAIRLDDAAGETVATGFGGVQLLTKFSSWSSKFTVVEGEKLFRNEKKNRAAVERALAPILAALPSQSAPSTSVEPVPPVPVTAPNAGEPTWPDFVPGTRAAVLTDLYVPAGAVEVPAVVRERYLELLRARLEGLGWKVFEPVLFETVYRSVATRLGGIYDPWTGTAVPGRSDSTLVETRRLVGEHLAAAVIVRPVIGVVLAAFKNEKATWDGVTEPVADLSTLTKILVTTSGKTEALSFAVFATDANGRELHALAGGIQLVAKIEGQRFMPVPRENLFRDPARDERAVDLALHGFPKP